MICPKCHKGKLEVVNTAFIVKKEAVRRIRACSNTECGFSQITWEHINITPPPEGTPAGHRECNWLDERVVGKGTLDTRQLTRHLRICPTCRERVKEILLNYGRSIRNFRVEQGVYSFEKRKVPRKGKE